MNKRFFIFTHNLKLTSLYKLVVFIFVFSVMGACSKEEEEPEETRRLRQDLATLESYIENNQIEATKGTSEYFYYKLRENPDENTPTAGSIVEFYYKIFLLDGTEVASHTAANGAPIKTRHASNTIFPIGVDAGLQHIRKGEIHRVLLPSALAFYNYTNASIPQYSNLIVEIELVDIITSEQQKAAENALIEQYVTENELGTINKLTSGLYYKVIEAGDGSIPTRGNRVFVAYEGRLLDGTVFDKSEEGKTFDFTLGANPQQVISGWEQGIPLMQKGEKSMLIIPSHLAYGETFTVVPENLTEDLIEQGIFDQRTASRANLSQTIPSFSILIFDVTLEDIK
jgi:FKBP-type peptidyl-prolyl cis-trans isomerase